MAHLREGIKLSSDGQIRAIKSIAPELLERVKQNAKHPASAFLLAKVCVMCRGADEDEEPSKLFVEAAELIAKQYASSPEIENFCQCLGTFVAGSQPWAGCFESHLRAILNLNKNRFVRCTASMALASVVALDDKRKAEAEGLHKRFLAEFDGQTNYLFQMIERQYGELGKIRLDEFKTRGIGMLAPEIEGVDTNGQSMKLSDYRGKVVLVSFWATWCGPCMNMIPRERELAARLEGEPFAIVGVNGDSDQAALQNAVTTQKITWRSFRDRFGRLAGKRPISDEWQVLGWPTLYLIDRGGIIRKRWTSEPTLAQLNREVDRLVHVAATVDEIGDAAKKNTTAAWLTIP